MPAISPAQEEPRSVRNYTCCLKANGKLKRCLRGLETTKRCKIPETQVFLASGVTTDNLENNLQNILDLGTNVDERLLDVETRQTAVEDELAERLDGKIFLGTTSTSFGRNTFEFDDGLLDNTAVGSSATVPLS